MTISSPKALCMLLAGVILLGACTLATPSSASTPTRRGELTPYRPVSPTFTPTSWARRPTAALPASPTPTPFLHIITSEDTLLSIAYRYGVELDALMAANPGVDPYLLSPGKTLVIPLGGDIPLAAPVPTLVPLQTEPPRCYPAADGGLWCLMRVVNDQPGALENLAAWVGLYTPDGELLTSQTALPPLNLLLPQQALPLSVYFPPPLPDRVIPQADLISALAVIPDPTRYLTTTVSLQQTEISPTGLQATLQGVVSVAEDGPPARLVWVAAVAYDASGHVVGVRKWEAAAQSGDGWRSLPFTLAVFSLGDPIARVEALAEAHP